MTCAVMERIGRIKHLLCRARELSPIDWCYLAIAVKELLIARVRHAAIPIGRILRELREPPSGMAKGRSGEVDLDRLTWALGAAAVQVPWRSDCMLRVMAADRWLRRHGRNPEFFLGVRRPSGPFEGHVWLYCDGVSVTGGTGEDYTTLMQPSSWRV